jgi:hypothetical protein
MSDAAFGPTGCRESSYANVIGVHVGANASCARFIHERTNGVEVLMVIDMSAPFVVVR